MNVATPAGVHRNVNGVASGWGVSRPVPGGRWHWSAYGPRGSTMSTAATHAEAAEKASREAERLRGMHDAVARG